MVQEVGKPKREDYPRVAIDSAVQQEVVEKMGVRVASVVRDNVEKFARDEALDALKDDLLADFEERDDVEISDVKAAFKDIVKEEVRARILDGVRPDGRGLGDIRALAAETGISPRAHGSGLFSRGETQVLSLATLGTPREAQRLDTLAPGDEKRYMHHYNFPPFSTGETWFMRGPKRREIGHGALAETALRAVLPDEEEFALSLIHI